VLEGLFADAIISLRTHRKPHVGANGSASTT
jgi:hypothetical protein